MARCHICSKQTSSTRDLGCSRCKNSFHLDCLNLSPEELTLVGAGWVCSYCKKEGRSLRSKPSSSTTQIDSQQFASASLSSDQFALLMGKLNEIYDDISIIKTNQQVLQIDLSECKSKLEKHSSEILRHSDTLATHSQTIDRYDLDIACCSSRFDLLAEGHRFVCSYWDS
ncbi:origin of replication complex subunit 1A-like [Coccinella septempunctata]|uniref:origin of replication complex subunit 1A-like n=1 Tax=Coccinella septempunctata TaxID=41139 RepID=UPI001D08AFB8|nr:origin of replication complex subunit 1A-like [Coccinella septempunctata]